MPNLTPKYTSPYRVLGVDPGIARVGYGVVEEYEGKLRCVEYGCITTEAHTEDSQRLEKIFLALQKLIETHHPNAVAYEDLFYFKNQKTIIQVAQARGVLLLAASLAKKRICHYTPLQVKQAVAGYGKAEKLQVQKMVQKLLGLSSIPAPDDAADGLALAICCVHSTPFHLR